MYIEEYKKFSLYAVFVTFWFMGTPENQQKHDVTMHEKMWNSSYW